jgi:methyl-accepting chemotaxis protein
MTALQNFPIWLRISLGRKLIIVSILFSVMLGALVAFTAYTINSKDADEMLSDICRRQRTLAERYIKEVVLTSQGMRIDRETTMKQLIENADTLADGGVATDPLNASHRFTVPPAATPDFRQSLMEQKALAKRLEADSDKYLHMADNDPKRAAARDSLLDLSAQLSNAATEAVKVQTRNTNEHSKTLVGGEALFGIFVAFAGILLSWLMSASLVRPLERCVAMATAIADGNLKLEPLEITSGDEVGKLAYAFNAMLTTLREVAINSHTATENLSSAAAEILASTQQQAANTKEQAAAVQQITSTVEEISQSGKQVADRARQVVASAEAVSNSGIAGLQAAHDASRAMESIREQAEMVAENIIALSERTQAVGEIIATVNEIAEQSNLVALNAAIEAADAREQGRRFSVVANEIKNLADQAKEATKQVRSILEQTQKGINTSVMLTEEALKRVEMGREKAEVSEQTIRQMSDNIQESVYAFQQIGGATNQQQIGLEQVTQALHEIRQASLQTAASTGELEKASLNLTVLGGQLSRTMEKYRT